MERANKPLPRGRPRSFDADAALDRAVEVFWRKGYDGASLDDLTAAMGISRPSLYAAFGNKAALYRKALDRYADGPAAFVRCALEAPTAREVAAKILRGSIERQADKRNPPGCLMVQGTLACSDEAKAARKDTARRRKVGDEALRKRFERSVKEGDLPPKTDAAALAGYLIAVVRGMAVQAAGGASRGELEGIAEITLRAFPS